MLIQTRSGSIDKSSVDDLLPGSNDHLLRGNVACVTKFDLFERGGLRGMVNCTLSGLETGSSRWLQPLQQFFWFCFLLVLRLTQSNSLKTLNTRKVLAGSHSECVWGWAWNPEVHRCTKHAPWGRRRRNWKVFCARLVRLVRFALVVCHLLVFILPFLWVVKCSAYYAPKKQTLMESKNAELRFRKVIESSDDPAIARVDNRAAACPAHNTTVA